MKCQHGVYIPEGEAVALYCAICNPDGVPDGPIPILPRSAADLFNMNKTEGREYCPRCECLRTYSQDASHPVDTCRVCGFKYPPKASRNQSEANAHPTGSCPECGSLVHYEVNKKTWECADCGKKYPAVRRQRVN